jgi:pimeloyl-ACP methyl ester carboxylesterase
MKEIIIDSTGGIKLYAKLYLKNKKLPTIILLHGLGFHSFEYEELAPRLSKGGFNCLCFDFRSHGKSEGKRGYWTLENLIDDLRSVISYVSANVNKNIGVFGNSLGATVAVYTAAEDRRIKSLVASDCATRPMDFGMTPFRRVLLIIFNFLAKIIPIRISVNYFIPYKKILSNAKIIEIIENDKIITNARKFSPSTYKDMFEWDATKVVNKIRVPLLVIQGKQDRLQSIDQSTMLFESANNPKELKLINTGHLPNLENVVLLSKILEKWFSKNLV